WYGSRATSHTAPSAATVISVSGAGVAVTSLEWDGSGAETSHSADAPADWRCSPTASGYEQASQRLATGIEVTNVAGPSSVVRPTLTWPASGCGHAWTPEEAVPVA